MDDLELQKLEAVAEAVPAVLELLIALDYEHDERVIGLSDALDILKGRNISNEHIGQEYDDGPWATGGSDSRPDYPRYESSDWSYTDATGPYHFLGPDVSDKDKVKQPVQIEPLKQGFLVEYVYDLGAARGFTDRVDLAEWLLEWLGFDDYQMVESALDILQGLSVVIVSAAHQDDHKRRYRNYENALGVAEAAQAFLEYTHPPTFDALKEAVKKWRGIEGE